MSAEIVDSISPEVLRLLDALGLGDRKITRLELVVEVGKPVTMRIEEFASEGRLQSFAERTRIMNLRACPADGD